MRSNNKNDGANNKTKKNDTSETAASEYAFRTLVQLKESGEYRDYFARDRVWKTHVSEWASIDNDYVGTDDAVPDFIKCMDVLHQNEKQEPYCRLVKITFPKELFMNAEHAEHFIYTMAQNLPHKGLTFDILRTGAKYDDTFAIQYHCELKDEIHDLLGMLYAYRDYTQKYYTIEMWDVSGTMSVFTIKELRND